MSWLMGIEDTRLTKWEMDDFECPGDCSDCDAECDDRKEEREEGNDCPDWGDGCHWCDNRCGFFHK